MNFPPAKTRRDEPAWEIAHLYPTQGNWSEQEYLALESSQLIEFEDGFIEVLDMPTPYHQELVLIVRDILKRWADARGFGKVYVSPVPLRLRPGKYREPDVMLVSKREWVGEQQIAHADLVVEIVSQDRERDFVQKRRDYASAEIEEYWIIDPRNEEVHVLHLSNGSYTTFGVFKIGQMAESATLEELAFPISELFDAEW